MQDQVKLVHWILGLAGGVCFWFLALAPMIPILQDSIMAQPQALVAYGAIILSYLGGIAWLRTMNTRASQISTDPHWPVWISAPIAIVPSLMALMLLALLAHPFVLVFAAAYLIIWLMIDLSLFRGFSPAYAQLRLVLTLLASSALLARFAVGGV